MLPVKYGGPYLYDLDFEKRCSIDYKDINFVKGQVYALIVFPDHPYGISTDNEYFFIHDDLFKRILETNQNPEIILRVIHKVTSMSSINDNSTYSRSKLWSIP